MFFDQTDKLKWPLIVTVTVPLVFVKRPARINMKRNSRLQDHVVGHGDTETPECR